MRPPNRFATLLVVATLAACSTVPQEYQPIIDSLHTPEMEAAINAARQGDARTPAAPANTQR
jgi:hypothetical protein